MTSGQGTNELMKKDTGGTVSAEQKVEVKTLLQPTKSEH